MKIAVGVNERRNSVTRRRWAPAIVDAFAGEREVKAEIGGGMRFA